VITAGSGLAVGVPADATLEASLAAGPQYMLLAEPEMVK
jgi:hypothetical protein